MQSPGFNKRRRGRGRDSENEQHHTITVQTASDCTFDGADLVAKIQAGVQYKGEMYCSATAVILTYPQIYHVCQKHEAEARPAPPFLSLLRKEEMHTYTHTLSLSLSFSGSLGATHKNMQVWISRCAEGNGTLLSPSHELPLQLHHPNHYLTACPFLLLSPAVSINATIRFTLARNA